MSALDKIQVNRAAFQQSVDDLHADAYKLQGRRAFESTRRAAALHEAGHAVAYAATADHRRWWPPYRVTIFRSPEVEALGLTGWFGLTTVSPKAPMEAVDSWDEEGCLVQGIREIAGVLSEAIFDRQDFRFGSSADEVALFNGMMNGLAVRVLVAKSGFVGGNFSGSALCKFVKIFTNYRLNPDQPPPLNPGQPPPWPAIAAQPWPAIARRTEPGPPAPPSFGGNRGGI